VLSLSACGGSGSGGPPPAAALDSTSLTYSALALGAHTITVTPDPGAFTFSNFSSGPVVRVSAPATGGIQSVSYTPGAAGHGGLTFTFAAPSDVGAGEHQSVVQVQVCLDTNCMSQVAAFTVTVTYDVTASVSATGTSGYSMTALAVPLTHTLAGNPGQANLFLGIAANAATHAGGVAVLDPVSGLATYSAQPYGDNVVLAGDGSTIYAWPTTVCSNVPPCSTTITPLSSALAPGAFTLTVGGSVSSLAVAPAAPQTIAVAYYGGSYAQVFDGNVGRPQMLTSVTGQYPIVQWLSSESLYVLNMFVSTGSVFEPCSNAVAASGIAAPGQCATTEYMTPMGFNFAAGLGYGQSGAVVNPATWATVATLSLPTEGTIEASPLPDAALNRLFVIEQTSTGTGCLLQSFTLSTLQPIASLDLPADANGHCLDAGAGLVRFGANGLAFNAAGASPAIVTISGAFVGG
jgi:hypothetical protein